MNVLVRVLQHVLEDESFKIKTPATIQARESAECFLEWCLNEHNRDGLKVFTEWLTGCLQNVISSSVTKSFNYNKEKMWREFYLLRTSGEFIKHWKDFIPVLNRPVQPVLYQHLTDEVFKILIERHFQIVHLEQDAPSEIETNEGNALRYVAGYVCRHLRKKIEKENHEFKEEMVSCLMQLVRDKNSQECETDEQWTKRVDRGGLWYVKETTFQLFCAIEYQIRAILNQLKEPLQPSKVEMIRKVTSDEDVQFYWIIASADFDIDDDDEACDILLNKIVELFLTVRGFSLASIWMERYKQTAKKSTQRSKSLRRELHDSTSVP